MFGWEGRINWGSLMLEDKESEEREDCVDVWEKLREEISGIDRVIN